MLTRSVQPKYTAVAIVRQDVQYMCGWVWVCVCNDLRASMSVQSIISTALNRSSNLEHRLPDKWRTIIPFTAETDLCSAHARRPTSGVTKFSLSSTLLVGTIFTDFHQFWHTESRIAELIFKTEFVCVRKRKYFARRISLFLRYIRYSISRLKTTFFIPSSPYLATCLTAWLYVTEHVIDKTGSTLSIQRSSDFRYYKGPCKKNLYKITQNDFYRQNIRPFYGNRGRWI